MLTLICFLPLIFAIHSIASFFWDDYIQGRTQRELERWERERNVRP